MVFREGVPGQRGPTGRAQDAAALTLDFRGLARDARVGFTCNEDGI